MADLGVMDLLTHYITPTRYCWPIITRQELIHSSANLLSRVSSRDADADYTQHGVEASVDRQVLITNETECVALSPIDETGKRILFVNVLSPLPRDRSQTQASLDDTVNDRPLLITILLPDMGFNLSEVEASYRFSVGEALEDNFGSRALEYVILHNDSFYVNIVGCLVILNQQHPAILLALTYALPIREDLQASKVYQILLHLDEQLMATMEFASEELMHDTRIRVLKETVEYVESILWDEDISWVSQSQVAEALSLLINDEIAALERQYNRILRTYDTGDVTPMEVCDGKENPNIWRMVLGTNRVRHRLFLLRQTIPST